ncbi:MAG: hypothetical protein NT031_10110 [Planctomycetota bacterium]|nr:hypothetical protein [Planctomycetota bacterium]
MTRRVRIITTVAGAIVAGGVVFAIAAGVWQSPQGAGGQVPRMSPDAAATRPAEEGHARHWLGAEADPEYRAQIRQLNEDVRRQRKEFARLLEQPQLSDQLVKEQSEKVIAAQNALQRRVVAHVLKIQGALPPERRAVLLRMMASRLGERADFDRPGGAEGSHGGPAAGTHRRTPESAPAASGPRRDREREHERRNHPASGPAFEPPPPALP